MRSQLGAVDEVSEQGYLTPVILIKEAEKDVYTDYRRNRLGGYWPGA